MSLEDQRVEIPFDERDQLVETARWFSEAPDDMSAWRALVDAVETARPIHTDPLDRCRKDHRESPRGQGRPRRPIAQGVPRSPGRTSEGGQASRVREPRQSQSAWCPVADRRLAALGTGRAARGRRRTGKEPAGTQAGGRHRGGRAGLARWHYYCPGRQKTAAAYRQLPPTS